MAQQSQEDTSKILCRYFMQNTCLKGSSCSFSHDRNTPPDLVCRFYLKGQCTYGDQCRYDHDRSRKTSSSNNNNRVSIETQQKPVSSPEIKGSSSSGVMKAPSWTSIKDSEPRQSNLVPLGQGRERDNPVGGPALSVQKSPEEWVKAKEFVPGQFYTGAVAPTYASAVSHAESWEGYDDSEEGGLAGAVGGADVSYDFATNILAQEAQCICPFMMAKGECRKRNTCRYLHLEKCTLCEMNILHPTDLAQREQHEKECLEMHELDMDHSFKVAASKEKVCGICMDVVLEKEQPAARRFGILENCNHCFCLNCIRQWRCAKQFEKVIIKACPECRVTSDFVTPSELWVDSPEEKRLLILGYQNALKEKPCRHFDQGRGECPFNDKCFYKHALPDGTIAPPRKRQTRRVCNDEGDLMKVCAFSLWDFLEHRDFLSRLEEELSLDVMNYLTVSELLSLAGSDSDSDSEY